MAELDDWLMGALASQDTYRGEDWPDQPLPPSSGPTRITVRPADSMYPAREPPPSPLLPPPRNEPATAMGELFFPNLSKPETYGPEPPPTMEAGPGGKVPTGDPRFMGGLTDIGNTLYNFVGPSGGAVPAAAGISKGMLLAAAKMGDRAALVQAQKMARAGATPDEIWAVARRFQDAGGNWTGEIPDLGSKMRRISPTDYGTYRLPELLYHPALYEAEPRMRNVRVRQMSPGVREFVGENTLGFMEPGRNPIITYRGDIGPPAIRSNILHEGGHVIQGLHGLPSGASGSAPVIPGTPGWGIYQARARAIMSDIRSGLLPKMSPAEINDYAKQYAQEQTYYVSAGEAAARAIQERRDWPLKKLEAISPQVTIEKDVPYAQQIVTYGKKNAPAIAAGGAVGGLAALPDSAEAAPVPRAPIPRMGELAKPFYSAVENAVTAQRPVVMSAEQWMGTLRNTPGVKPDELQRLGVEKWLRQQPGAVPKQALQDYIAANKVRVGEEFLGNNAAKFKEYQLPGGENYRERLLTLPEQKVGDEFRGPHWDEPNVVAHYRSTDRDIGGKKTLFLEEVQSDWHQQGRKGGYHGDPVISPEEFKAYQNEYRRLTAEIDALDSHTFSLPPSERDSYLKANGFDAKLARMGEIAGRLEEKKPVPDAPFRTSWPELTLKRAIREAAEGGYDQVAWTPGKVHSDRYAGGEEDLTHGMASFYDKMLPAAANKIGKKYGAQVGKAQLYEDPGKWQPFNVVSDAEWGNGPIVHTLPITPQLREQALRKGFPLFTLGAATTMGALASQDQYR